MKLDLCVHSKCCSAGDLDAWSGTSQSIVYFWLQRTYTGTSQERKITVSRVWAVPVTTEPLEPIPTQMSRNRNPINSWYQNCCPGSCLVPLFRGQLQLWQEGGLLPRYFQKAWGKNWISSHQLQSKPIMSSAWRKERMNRVEGNRCVCYARSCVSFQVPFVIQGERYQCLVSLVT